MKEWIRHKAVRISAIILLVLVCLIAAIIIIAQIYISAHKKELLVRANEELSSLLRGKVNVEDLNVNAWGYFPQIAIVLHNVSVTDSIYHRPLLQVKEVSTRIPLAAILRKKVIVRFVKLADGDIHLFTDTAGYTNQYLLSPKPRQQRDTAAPKQQIMIEEIELQNIHALSEDAVKNKRFEILFRKLNARIHKRDTAVTIDLREEVTVKGIGFNLEKGSYLANKTLDARWKLALNTTTKTLSFPQTHVKIDGHPFMMKGAFVFGDTTQSRFDLEVIAQKIRYQQAAALLTDRLQRKLAIVSLEKPLNISAHIQGSMAPRHNPRVEVNWEVTNNLLITPVARFDSCHFTGSYTNEVVKGLPLTDENSQIVLNHFTGSWGGAVFNGEKVVLSNLQKPILTFDVNSTCALTTLDNKTGLQTFHFTGGTAEVYLQYNGPVDSTVVVNRYLSGKLLLHDGSALYETRNLPFTHCNGELAFSPDEIHTTGMECNVGGNHFTVTLEGKNLSYLSGDNEQKASLECAVHTSHLNLADFRSLFARQKNRTTPRSAGKRKLAQAAAQFDDLLENGTFELKIRADTIVLNHFTATALNGDIRFQQANWEMQNISVEHAGGSLTLQGTLTEEEGNSHKAAVRLSLKNVDVRRVFYAFDNFGQKGISYNNLRGRLNTTASLQLYLNGKGDIVPNTLNGNVFFSIKDGELIKFEPMENLKSFVFKDKDLSHIQFAELKDSLIIRESDIQIRRMEIHSSIMTLYVEGLYSLRGNTDISIQIPLHNFLSKQEDQPRNKGANARMGASIHLRARPDLKGNIKISLDLFKKYRKQHKNDKL